MFDFGAAPVDDKATGGGLPCSFCETACVGRTSPTRSDAMSSEANQYCLGGTLVLNEGDHG